MAFAGRWHHFCSLLALFDVIVIAANLVLSHKSLGKLECALADVRDLDAKREWVTDLRGALVDINAPGNDVFETRDVVAERGRFGAVYRRLKSLA